ncbi:MAG: rod shape-determining protein MreD [Arenicella sp.]
MMAARVNFVGLFIVLLLCSFIASVLTIVNLPNWLFYFRPDWIALIVIYWVLAMPDRLGVVFGFIYGLLLDLLLIKAFGLNAFGFSCLAFAISRSYMQLRMFPIWQQALLVGVLIAIMKLFIGLLAGWVSDFRFTQYYWYSIAGDIVLWPFIYIILRDLRRSLKL